MAAKAATTRKAELTAAEMAAKLAESEKLAKEKADKLKAGIQERREKIAAAKRAASPTPVQPAASKARTGAGDLLRVGARAHSPTVRDAVVAPKAMGAGAPPPPKTGTGAGVVRFLNLR